MKKEAFVMPQTKGQGVVFGILMSVFMAYGMELYNVAAKVGGMENKVFGGAGNRCVYVLCSCLSFPPFLATEWGALWPSAM